MQQEKISEALKTALADSRLQGTHISLYLAILTIWEEKNFKVEFFSCRKNIMTRSKIRSFSTYHVKIRDLVDWGYISYLPSYHPLEGSKIALIQLSESKKAYQK
ncbi:hypothetical protein [Desertivirga brevis]|uniref:hypothetical protein n=1 Tax=Desertivirga brevis TaxID=2810310 RepID=UPI001A959C24|nr:hypothetical protein [Pedobacter sp. SYSU D00873]